MTELENKQIYHQIQLERVQNGVVKKCLIQLENANRKIAVELKKTKGIHTKARYNELRKYLKDVAKELKKNVNKDMDIDEFIDYELQTQIKLYKKYGLIELVAPSKEMVISTATFSPYLKTSTYANYLDSFELNFFNVWDSNLRAGYLNGLTTQQIVKNTMGYVAKDSAVADYGALHSLRNSLMTNTRSALQSFAEHTKELVYEHNSKMFRGYLWVGTLDRRQCIPCGTNDGIVKEHLTDFKERPILHPNCRCIIIALVKGEVFEEIDAEGTRASENGQVKQSLSFAEWLKEQPSEVQKDVLGETRYKMYKDGAELKDFVLDNRILTIKELKEKGL